MIKTVEKEDSLLHARSDLLHGPAPSNGGKWVTDLSQEQMQALAEESYTGTPKVRGDPIMEWLVSHYDFPRWSAKLQTIGFLLSFVFATAMPKSPLIVAKTISHPTFTSPGSRVSAAEKENGEEEDQVIASVLLTEWNPKKEKRPWSPWVRVWRFLKAVANGLCTKSIPETVKKKEEFKTQICHLQKKCKEIIPIYRWHKDFGPSNNHWYVNLLAVDPDYRQQQEGSSVGKELMERVAQLADKQGMDCYLEAGGENNRTFYEHFGFCVQATKVLNDAVDVNHEPLFVYLMTRRARCDGHHDDETVKGL